MQSRSYLFLVLVLALAGLSFWGYSAKGYNQGLDIRGGVRLVYQMDTNQLKPEQRNEMGRIRSLILQTLTNRASGSFGAVEANVAPKGDDQFIIELPGFTNLDEAKEVLGTSARIEFYHARNVVSPRNQFAMYDSVSANQDGQPNVNFRRRSGVGDDIKFGTPEYENIIKGWGDPILAGEDVADAQAQMTPSGGAQPLFIFSGEGATKMERWSRANPQGALAIVLDGRVLSLNYVEQNTVLRDNAVITGQLDIAYVKNLTDLVKSGALPVDLDLLSSEKIDPTIGQGALDKIIIAGAISFGVIVLFLIGYYAFPGFIALLALGLYVLFTLTALKLINATFSLAAIAGFILSVGMAVDANILVFERFKEEMKAGKSLNKAIHLGFTRALPAIVDSNACTILTSLVLVNLGTGPVKGFATTLIIGVAISLFTAVFVTRSLLVFFIDSGIATNSRLFAVERNWFGEKFEANADVKPLPVVQKSKKWFMLSTFTVIPGLIFIALGGLKPNVEFLGGSEVTYRVADAALTSPQLAAKMEAAGFKGVNVKFGTGKDNERIAYITLPPGEKLQVKNEQGETVPVNEAQIKEIVGQSSGLASADFRGYTNIGPTVQQETVRNAVLGVVLSAGLIILYLALRFGVKLGNFVAGLRFGFSAIGALVHDILVVIGFAGIFGFFFGWEISALFLTSMLTIIGFSVHDTIVIFDRIRENLGRPLPNEDFQNLVNRSITQSFARSLNTSMTVIATLLIIGFGGAATPDLKFFVFTMLVGIVSGTYSSIYNASPILYLWDKAVERKKGKAATLVALAQHEIAKAQVIGTRPVPAGVGAPVPSTPTAPADPVASKASQYGQVRRRANAPKRNSDLDD